MLAAFRIKTHTTLARAARASTALTFAIVFWMAVPVFAQSGFDGIGARPCCCETKLSVDPGVTYALNASESYDCVTIAPTAKLIVTGAHVLSVTGENGLTIKPGGKLFIEDGGKLRLTSASEDPGHRIDGQILLTGDSSVLSIEHDTTVYGTGRIEGWDPDAEIQIAGTRTLTNLLAENGEGIRGAMRIVGLVQMSGTGMLHNQGLVEASAGAITLKTTTQLSDTAGAVWGADLGELSFQRVAGLTGDFRAGLVGTLRFDADIFTTGNLGCEVGGFIDVDVGNGVEFTYLYGNPGETSIRFDCACLLCP